MTAIEFLGSAAMFIAKFSAIFSIIVFLLLVLWARNKR